MGTGTAEVIEDVGVVAAGVFQGIREDRCVLESLLLIDRPCHRRNQTVVVTHPIGFHVGTTKRVAENVMDQGKLSLPFRLHGKLAWLSPHVVSAITDIVPNGTGSIPEARRQVQDESCWIMDMGSK